MSKSLALNGTDEYVSKSSPIGLDNSGASLFLTATDKDFETSIGNWIAEGNHAFARSTADHHGGSAAGKITASAAGNATTNRIRLPYANLTDLVVGKAYTLEVWAKSDTAATTITMLVGDKIFTSGSLTTVVTVGTFSKINFLFVATANTISQDLILYINKAANVYVDDLVFKPIYDIMIAVWCKFSAITNKMIYFRGNWGPGFVVSLGNGGTGNGFAADNLSFSVRNGSSVTAQYNAAALIDGNYHLVVGFTDVHATISANRIRLYVDGVNKANNGANLGDVSVMGTQTSFIGSFQGNQSFFSDEVGELQYVIFQEGVPADLTTIIADMVTNGMLSAYANGSIKIWHDWRGATDGAMLTDKSGTGNSATGTNITQAGDQVLGGYASQVHQPGTSAIVLADSGTRSRARARTGLSDLILTPTGIRSRARARQGQADLEMALNVGIQDWAKLEADAIPISMGLSGIRSRARSRIGTAGMSMSEHHVDLRRFLHPIEELKATYEDVVNLEAEL